MTEERKVVVQWIAHPHPGWWATYPSGRRHRWTFDPDHHVPFIAWITSFLRHDGDVVEVHYPKTISTYRLTVRKRGHKKD